MGLTFVSGEDAMLLALALACAGTLAIYAARLVAGRVTEDLEAVRGSMHAIGEGNRPQSFEASAAEELVGLASTANRMSVKLDQRTDRRDAADAERDAADAARRELLAAISHDLRTPLASLRALAEAIEHETDEDARREGQPREAPARALQPDRQRGSTHAAETVASTCAPSRRRRWSRWRSGTAARGSPQASTTACSSPSTVLRSGDRRRSGTRDSGWRSAARSWRHTAGLSGAESTSGARVRFSLPRADLRGAEATSAS